MKNIHVLSTPKPSRLWFYKQTDILLTGLTVEKSKDIDTQHLYITNDEEIKEDVKWIIHNGKIHEVIENKELYISVKELNHIDIRKDFCKKIILTTDQDLINDGVQAIDDEFLEWFVKNPSCEEVEVESNKCLVKRGQCSCSYQDIDCQCLGYKIIIPKEEPIHLLSCCKSLEECYCGKYPKQETLEEAALTLFPGDWSLTERELFKQGAEWQQEQMEKLKDFDTWKEWKNKSE